jgi:hypothetical protein
MKFSSELKKSLKSAQENYIKAKILNDEIESITNECKIKVLAENEFFESEEYKVGQRILKPFRDFMMSDLDFEKYCKLVYNEYIEKGLEVPNYNTTTNYKSRPNLLKAENELFKIGVSIIPQENRKDLERSFNIISKRDEILKLMPQLELD